MELAAECYPDRLVEVLGAGRRVLPGPPEPRPASTAVEVRRQEPALARRDSRHGMLYSALVACLLASALCLSRDTCYAVRFAPRRVPCRASG